MQTQPQSTISPAEDLQARLTPSDRSVRLAEAMLAAEPAASYAVIPMAFPRKTRGLWFTGQEVHTVEGVALLVSENRVDRETLPDGRWARDRAEDLALARLRHLGEAGTTGYAYLYRDGYKTVHEGMLRAD
jgi:hypothetical protein